MPEAGPIRVLITDDSGTVRAMLRSFLADDPAIEVIGEACNGAEAVAMARELRPNLVTMDLEMPVMDGMQAIEEIMASRAVPILVVSSVADAQKAYQAVARGALDVMARPDIAPAAIAGFIAKVKMLAKVPVITHLRPRQTTAEPLAVTLPLPACHADSPRPSVSGRVFAIASSTGGPQALSLILAALPADFPAPIIVAQHISDGFAAGMAEWLGKLCKLKVRLAEVGDRLQAGTIYISPSEATLSLTPARSIELLPRPGSDIYRPNCNAMLASLASVCGADGVAIILTGMGRDGAEGMARVKDAGGQTLAQDEGSSVIFGMNKVAIDAGAIRSVLPLAEIAAAMQRLAGNGGGRAC